jgi:RNA polymerase sigma-70 factor (ECF subfamily)
MLGDPEEARDVTQEAFLRLWEHHPDVVDEAAVSWLLRTTRRLCLDRIRRMSRRATYALADLDPAEVDGGAVDGDERAALREALAMLAFRDRAAIMLREVQGLSYAELATVLEMPVGSVKAALHRARQRLRDAMRMQEVDA